MQQTQNHMNTDLSQNTKYSFNNCSLNNCRFYPSDFPAVGDLVIGCTSRIAECGAYEVLIEYNNIEGFVNPTSSGRQLRRFQTQLMSKKLHVMKVARVDKDKMCIDLEMKSIDPQAKVEAMERF
jgi:translation initiation factor 2 alpha subunit (eIF-2alpha)